MADASSACDMTQCGLCKESDSKLLPCLHSVCLTCLQQQAANTAPETAASLMMPCPLCEDAFRIPARGLTDLPNNCFTAKMRAANKLMDSAAACDVCSHDGASPAATAHCTDCTQYMCTECAAYHHKFTATRTHTVVQRSDEQSEGQSGSGKAAGSKTVTDWCEAHANRLQELFCLDCQAVLCIKCYMQKHGSHNCTGVESAADGFREELQTTVDTLDQLSMENSADRNALRQARDRVRDQISEVELIVLRTRERLIACVEEDTNQLMADLNHFRDLLAKEYTTSKHVLKTTLEKVDHLDRFTKEIIQEGSPSVLASVSRSITQRGEEVRLQQTKHHNKKRPKVDVIFQSLGLSNLSQPSSAKRPVNLVGRVAVDIVSANSDSRQSIYSSFTSAVRRNNSPVFKFSASPSPRPTQRKVPVRSRRYSSVGSSGNTLPTEWHKLYPFAGSSSASKAEHTALSSDEEELPGLQDNDASEIQTPQLESLDKPQNVAEMVEKFIRRKNVLFSHAAKLYRFLNGSWLRQGAGVLKLVKDLETALLLMTDNKKVDSDFSLELVDQSKGRELSWVSTCPASDSAAAVDETGQYEMRSVRFKSRTVTDNFRFAVNCAQATIRISEFRALPAAVVSVSEASASAATVVSKPLPNCETQTVTSVTAAVASQIHGDLENSATAAAACSE